MNPNISFSLDLSSLNRNWFYKTILSSLAENVLPVIGFTFEMAFIILAIAPFLGSMVSLNSYR